MKDCKPQKKKKKEKRETILLYLEVKLEGEHNWNHEAYSSKLQRYARIHLNPNI